MSVSITRPDSSTAFAVAAFAAQGFFLHTFSEKGNAAATTPLLTFDPVSRTRLLLTREILKRPMGWTFGHRA